jgi:hypothetical protein
MSTLTQYLNSLGPWNWLIFAALLLGLELVVPGVHFLWFGVAALVVWLVVISTGISWPLQLFLFAAMAVVTLFWVRRLARPDQVASDVPDLNVRANQYLGRIVIVEEAIRNGRGKVRVGDTLWVAEGTDIEKGARAKVTGVNDTVLRVERATA